MISLLIHPSAKIGKGKVGEGKAGTNAFEI